MKDMKKYGVASIAVVREIVALQGTDRPRGFPPLKYWGLAQLVMSATLIKSRSPVRLWEPQPNGYHLPPLNGRVIEKVTIKVRQALPTFYIGA